MLSKFQREVATIALRVAGQRGFALAGGGALGEYGVIDRFTADVNLHTDENGAVGAVSEAVEAALVAAGFTVDRQDMTTDQIRDLGDYLAEWFVVAPDGEQMLLIMAYSERDHRPVTMEVGPVLSLDDIIDSKTVALIERADPRDFADVAAFLADHRVDELIARAQRYETGLQDRYVAAAGRQLDDLDDEVFARYGLQPADVALIRERFAGWPR